ncbi:MAG TPA: hypothetical protein VMT30_04845 [Candidatus Saccharimonadia bacterium]|nr:hypothetical protein [Candidatus Saccharimonadia bacterium]
MPILNAYYTSPEQLRIMEEMTPAIKQFVAAQLTCGELSLSPGEVTVRLMQVEGSGMIGDVEIDMVAHEFQERVEDQDGICQRVKAYLEQASPGLGEVRVWLNLGQLGHSWKAQ